METITIKAQDDYKLDVHIFTPKQPKAVVQIIHGMEEYQERYERFANYLVENNYCVISSNMRGHGINAHKLGHFKDEEGYKYLISDQIKITEFIKNKFKGLPIFIFAHSMGTIITRVMLQEHSNEYKKVVLSGYPNYQSGAKLGILITKIIKLFKGSTYKSKFVQKLAIGAFNKKFKNPRTELDWLSANPENVNNYISDPLCGIGFTTSAFNDLFHLVIKMHQPKKYKNINSEMSILMLRGTDDPCTGGEKGAKDSRTTLKKAGFKKILHIDYENMRHEILNETNYQQVENDIVKFLNN